MKKSVVLSLSALLAFTAIAECAFAQEVQRTRRPGFFERLFGGFDRPSRRPVRQARWWDEDTPEIRIIRGGREDAKRKKVKKVALLNPAAKPPEKIKRRAIPAVTIDPDVAEGLGMGNLEYVAPKLVTVADSTLSQLIGITPDSAALRAVLTDRKSVITATPAVREAVLDLYKSNSFKPLWTADGNISSRGLAVLDMLAAAGEEGLDPSRYKPVVLNSYQSAVSQLDGDGLGLALFDVGLSVAAVTYALHQSGGAFEPELLSGYHDLKSKQVAPNVALRVLAYSPFPTEYLKSLAPKHPAYAKIKAELLKVSGNVTEQTPAFASGNRVRIGQKDPRIIPLRQRLFEQNFISLTDATVAPEKRDILDKTLAKALKQFQKAKAIAQTSNLDAATVAALNGPDQSEQKDKLIASLERLRWMADDFGKRYVFVNQAAYRVNVIEDGNLLWASNVIVGKPLTQTAVFSDRMETVVFNPSWGVPESIILNEYLPKLRANPGYLDKIGFQTLSPKGKLVKSSSINWNSIGANSGIAILQPPGDGNALGEIKFLFPNAHSIYMHDTPNRKLFGEAKRNFSHGCVRVENPREFAEILLGWDRAKVDANIDSGENTSTKVTVKTDVHLAYFTAWPDENGIMQYYSDAYGRDISLKKARDLTHKSMTGDDGQKIVENNP
jgi:L,D-transpeptidase YcbB